MHDGQAKSSWLGPGDHWPAHPRPQAQQALKRARKAGFHLRPSKDHTFGFLGCGCKDDPVQECRESVLKTSGPKDGSVTARYIDDLVRKCPHDRVAQEADHSEDPLDEINGILYRLPRFLDACDSLLKAAASFDAAQASIDEAIAGSQDEDDLVEKAAVLEAAGLQAGHMAKSHGMQADEWADGWPPADGAREVCHRASAAHQRATDLLAAHGDSWENDRARVDAELQRLGSRLKSCVVRAEN